MNGSANPHTNPGTRVGESVRMHVARKVFEDPPTVALENVEIEAAPGEFLVLVGPSGAGKSTLLSIAAGLDGAYEGEVVHGAGAGRTAFVFQTPRLMPWLSVLDNVKLVLEGEADADARARELLDLVGLSEFVDAFPNRLSGGMQRRASLARAFVINPGLLLMDEPFVSLDDPLAWRLRSVLLDLWERSRPTVIYVTHDLREAVTLADRIVFLSARPGRVILERSIDLARPRVPNSETIERLYRELLRDNPQLLSGSVGAGGGQDLL